MVKLSWRTHFVVAKWDVAGAYFGVVLEGVAPVLVHFEAGCQMRGGDSERMLLEVQGQVLLAKSNLAEQIDPLLNEVVELLLSNKAYNLVPAFLHPLVTALEVTMLWAIVLMLLEWLPLVLSPGQLVVASQGQFEKVNKQQATTQIYLITQKDISVHS